MKCVIKLTHRVTGNSFYFMNFKRVNGHEAKPVSCMKYRAAKAATVFPSIGAACCIVKCIDPAVWHCRIRPASVLSRLGGISA